MNSYITLDRRFPLGNECDLKLRQGAWLPRKNVCSSALVFHFRRVGSALDDVFNRKSCGLDVIPDCRRLKHGKIH